MVHERRTTSSSSTRPCLLLCRPRGLFLVLLLVLESSHVKIIVDAWILSHSKNHPHSSARKMSICQRTCYVDCSSKSEPPALMSWNKNCGRKIQRLSRCVLRSSYKDSLESEQIYEDHDDELLSFNTAASTWSEADDWSQLSFDSSQVDTSELYNQDLALKAAQTMSKDKDYLTSQPQEQEEEKWISSMVEDIYDNSHYAQGDDGEYIPLFDFQFDKDDDSSVEEAQGLDLEEAANSEIAMLVRCNERPQDLLISEGRAYAPLTESERNDVWQLVSLEEGDQVVPTEFFKTSVSKIFHQHASTGEDEGAIAGSYLDRKGVAQWMTQALISEDHGRPVSPHDRRVLQTLSDYGSYGSGQLVEDEFQNLYFRVIVGNQNEKDKKVSWKRHLAFRQEYVNAVWRDLRNHGILSPIEQERHEMLLKVAAAQDDAANKYSTMQDETLMDECQILDWDFSASTSQESSTTAKDRQTASKSKSSHRLVEMAPRTKTPLWLKDGDFIFIDEDSCIGCRQCVNISPDSFLMLDSGRARTFEQRQTPDVRQAVASCPVACMHRVTFGELEEYESARDEGDGREDHRYLGQGRHIPLHVAGMDSDNNRKSSWYHTLKARCVTSSQCPQKGCYNCPKYSQPGDNPYFQAKQKRENHIRSKYFVNHGDFDSWRKSAEL